jgi:thioredoxin 1
MSFHTLNSTNRRQVASILSEGKWVVACLCAAWCDVCRQYRSGFESLAAQHPDKHFIWIDIEDEADIVGDFDVENFPTLLIQRADTVAFFGTVLPETRQANRLLLAQTEKSESELYKETAGSPEKMKWQSEYNLKQRLFASMED